jgi:hypothetical protein
VAMDRCMKREHARLIASIRESPNEHPAPRS